MQVSRVTRFGRGWGAGLLAAAWLAGMVPAGWTAPSQAGPLVGTPDQQERWIACLSDAARGRFQEAREGVRQLLSGGVADERVRRIDGWLESLSEFQGERQRRIRAEYDKYVQWVREDLAGFAADGKRGWWRQAILDSARAMANAADEEAFRREPWLEEVVRGAVQAAAAYEQEQEWIKAARLYVPLSEIFPREKSYRDALRHCQEHLRLELMYAPESEWKETVSGIVPDMARDAFAKIEGEYLREPNFREAAIDGIRQIIRMTEHPRLQKVFPEMGQGELVEEFVDRLRANLRQVEDRPVLSAAELVERFDRVLDINRELGIFPENVVVYEFVHGALQPLDRFSDMLWPSDIEEFNKHTQGRFSGVGIQIRKQPGEPIQVISPLEDTPAYRKGIQPNDLITRIDGRPTEKISVTQAVREITGRAGTTVTLTIRRDGVPEEFPVELERQEITIFTIKGHKRDAEGHWNYMIDPAAGIAYLRMTNFTDGTIDELRAVVTELRDRQGLRGLIFDLRGNPGGPLKAAVEVADLFLDGGKRIVSTKDRNGQPWVKSATDDTHFYDFPMILLVDSVSASASEIVAGALQVHGRALLVGERTYGKGSVQQVLRLNNSNRAYLKLTTALYYLPNERCLHREDDAETWGVDPDVSLRLVPKEFVRMRELLMRNDILKGKDQKELSDAALESVTRVRTTTGAAGGEEDSTDGLEADAPDGAATRPADQADEADEPAVDRSDENTFPQADAQLEAALALMRIRLESDVPWPLGGGGLADAGR